MTPDDLRALAAEDRRHDEAAEGGPWTAWSDPPQIETSGPDYRFVVDGNADAAAIVHARNSLASRAEALEWAAGEIERLRRECDARHAEQEYLANRLAEKERS